MFRWRNRGPEEVVGHSTRTGPDSKTPSKLEAEPSNGLEAAMEEMGLGKELSRSPLHRDLSQSQGKLWTCRLSGQAFVLMH